MDNKKFYGLDLLRGIAGYGVAITHYFYFVQKKLDFEYYSFIFVENNIQRNQPQVNRSIIRPHAIDFLFRIQNHTFFIKSEKKKR